MAGHARPQIDPLDWLLENDNLTVQYLTRRDLVRSDLDWLVSLQEKVHKESPVSTILENMNPQGYWVEPGAGYSPKYTSTVWSIILLAQCGASLEIENRVAKAVDYVLDLSLVGSGQFSYNGLPSGTFDCLQGNLCAALIDLGCTDRRLDQAFEWMARSVTGEGVAPVSEKSAPLRYYASKCGPVFACGANNKLPCAWGAAKVMMAFSKLPRQKWTPLINSAVKTGVDFLFSRDPATADYPCGYKSKPSSNWWKFGFPVFYITDVLQIAYALVRLGYFGDRRLANTLRLIKEKQDAWGRWPLEYSYSGKTWYDFGQPGQPNKWVTLRALRVLKGLG